VKGERARSVARVTVVDMGGERRGIRAVRTVRCSGGCGNARVHKAAETASSDRTRARCIGMTDRIMVVNACCPSRCHLLIFETAFITPSEFELVSDGLRCSVQSPGLSFEPQLKCLFIQRQQRMTEVRLDGNCTFNTTASGLGCGEKVVAASGQGRGRGQG